MSDSDPSEARTGLSDRREHLEARKDDAELQAVSRGGRPKPREAEQVEETASSPSPSAPQPSNFSPNPSLGIALESSSSKPSSPPPELRSHSGAAPAWRSSTIPPRAADDLGEILRRSGADSFSPEEAIEDQIAELEAWALLNVRAERFDSLRLWGLRVLSFLGAGTAAAAAALQQTELAVGAGVLAAFAVVVDAAWPSVGDRAARHRAIHDLRELQHELRIKWGKVRLCHPNPTAPKRIAHALVLLDQIQAKRGEIGRYLGDASPGVARPRN